MNYMRYDEIIRLCRLLEVAALGIIQRLRESSVEEFSRYMLAELRLSPSNLVMGSYVVELGNTSRQVLI